MSWLISKIKNLRQFLQRGGVARVDSIRVPVGESMNGRRVVITGGGSGIGLTIASRCLEEGAQILITGRDEKKLLSAKESLGSECVKVLVWDVSDVNSVDDKLQEAERALGGAIDAFVNNAGISNRQDPATLTKDVWDGILKINLTGAIFAAQAMCRRWALQGRGGVLLNVTSTAGVQAVLDAYGTSKTAMIQLTRGWAKYWAPKGIRINSIAPGVIVGTEINRLQRSISPDDNLFCASYPAGRFGVPAEIAEVALFLLSDKSSYVYGQTIVCDGGATLS